jgi:hypothetical protein
LANAYASVSITLALLVSNSLLVRVSEEVDIGTLYKATGCVVLFFGLSFFFTLKNTKEISARERN